MSSIIDLTSTQKTDTTSNCAAPVANAPNAKISAAQETSPPGPPEKKSTADSIPKQITIAAFENPSNHIDMPHSQGQHHDFDPNNNIASQISVDKAKHTSVESRLSQMEDKLNHLLKVQRLIFQSTMDSSSPKEYPDYTPNFRSITRALINLYDSTSRIEAHLQIDPTTISKNSSTEDPDKD